MLNLARSAKAPVINAGVIGYSTDQEAAYLRVEGERYQPDLVLVAYYPVNDTHNKLHRYTRYARLRSIHPLLLELYTFPRHLYLREFIRGARRMLKLRLGQARMAVASELGIESPSALTDTANFSAWVKLMRNATPGNPRSINTLLPDLSKTGQLSAVRRRTWARFTRPRHYVEDKIARFLMASTSR